MFYAGLKHCTNNPYENYGNLPTIISESPNFYKGLIMSEQELIEQKFEINGKMKKVHFAIKEDNWINATEVAKLYGKRLDSYWVNMDTLEYIVALEKFNSHPEWELKQTVEGRYGGTYIHPDLVIHFARWANAEFAVQCDKYLKLSMRNEMIEDKREIHQLTLDLNDARELRTYKGGLISLRKYLKGKDLKEELAWEILVTNGVVYNAYPTVLKRMLNDERVGKQSKGKAPIFYPEFLDEIFLNTKPFNL